jgi:hypothetical protein
MSKPNKYAARFGDRYRIPGGENYLPVGFNIHRFSKAVGEAMPTIRRMTASLRVVAENMRRAREMEDTTRQVEAIFRSDDAARSAVWFAPVGTAAPTLAELEAGTPIRGLSHASFGTQNGGDVIDLRGAPEPVSPDDRIAEAFRNAGWIVQGGWRSLGHVGEDGLTAQDDRPLLARIDSLLYSVDAQDGNPDQDWPYRSF